MQADSQKQNKSSKWVMFLQLTVKLKPLKRVLGVTSMQKTFSLCQRSGLGETDSQILLSGRVHACP